MSELIEKQQVQLEIKKRSRQLKTHWAPGLSFALAEGSSADGERDGATASGAAWLTILADSCLCTSDSSEGIEA